jgi:hypothetical protein
VWDLLLGAQLLELVHELVHPKVGLQEAAAPVTERLAAQQRLWFDLMAINVARLLGVGTEARHVPHGTALLPFDMRGFERRKMGTITSASAASGYMLRLL